MKLVGFIITNRNDAQSPERLALKWSKPRRNITSALPGKGVR